MPASGPGAWAAWLGSVARTVGTIAWLSFRAYQRDRVPRLGAALSFYAALSLAPLLVVGVGVGSLVFSRAEVQRQVVTEVRDLAGVEGARVATTVLENAFNAYQPGTGLKATTLGVVLVLFGASGVLLNLKQALDHIWHVQPDPDAGAWQAVFNRLLSLALVLGVGFLLLVTLFVSAAVRGLNGVLRDVLAMPIALLTTVSVLVTLVLVGLLIALMYRYLPDTDVRWRDVAPAALVTSALFTGGKSLIGSYIGNSAITSAYGAAGMLAVFLLWVYYSAQIFFFGAEIAHTSARYFSATAHDGPRPGEADAPVDAPG